jgi:hypothetical protein
MKYEGRPRLRGKASDQVPELLDSQSRISRDTTHRQCIDWIATGNSDLDGHFNFANVFAAKLVLDNGQVFPDSVPDILDCFLLRRALGPAPRQSGHGHAVTFLGFLQCDSVLHPSLRS